MLTSEELAQLTGDEVPGAELAPIPFEPYDSALFDVLAVDGRATTAQLAEAAGISEGRAARRLAVLIRSRTLVIDLDLAHEVFGVTVGAQIYFAVAPARLHEVGEALARLPEVGFVAAMSGRHNLMASVACRDLAHLYEFMTGDNGTLDAIVSMEVVPLARMVKQSGGLIVDGRLIDPA
ncbi:MAG: transcriptional regulator, AsnC family [Nocardia sp.]|uniref:Lrp/AsnC family transcriptional regulator n=1 Tax=Nocardia sp. TaxID=1821 RepID=UPI002636E3EB|nr:Lrp/AsnC family transcriptional regulator [Nocardia sp.]MCU1641270.1 transcriptional regulator, AsnC family [Nocardia sp.]